MARSNRHANAARLTSSGDALRTRRKKATIIDLSSARPGRMPTAALPFLQLAHIVDVDKEKIVVAVASRSTEPLVARRLSSVSDLEPGDEVVVAFVCEDDRRPVILGRLFDSAAPSRDVCVNGRRVSIEADSELVLRCASATITIGRNGLIAVHGDRVTSHARSTNRIRGGSVEIN